MIWLLTFLGTIALIALAATIGACLASWADHRRAETEAPSEVRLTFDEIRHAVETVATDIGLRIAPPLYVVERVLARIEAQLGGWFWLPCPVCGYPFGGQEAKAADRSMPSTVPDPDESGSGFIICPDCQAAGFGYPLDVELDIWEVRLP